MGANKKIVLTLPSSLLAEVDGVAKTEASSRSELIRRATRAYLEERRRTRLREQMRSGYQEMAAINLRLAEEGLSPDEPMTNQYGGGRK
ncbi:MAG: ribbon-helix-helix protein, CopG family [Bacillota bacterium]